MDFFTFLVVAFFVLLTIIFVLFNIFYGIPNFHTIGSLSTNNLENEYNIWKKQNNM